jgi:DNA-binding transcriptional LysR family regulator
MLEISQLRCFVAVAEELHFGRAAARVFMTQPPLSRQIQLLENALGAQLLERDSRNVRLTATGQRFYTYAVSILRLAEDASVVAKRSGSGELGRVTVGFSALLGYAVIPNLISALQQTFPDIEITLKEMVSSQQVDALGSKTIDLAFIRPIGVEHPFQYYLVTREPMMLALPASHPLAEKSSIELNDLEQQRLIMYSHTEGKYFYDMVIGLFGTSGVNPRYVQYIGQTHTIMALVRAGLGMAIVPESAMHLRFENVVYRNLWRSDLFAETYLAWRADHLNPALETVRKFAIEYLAKSPVS